MRPRLKLSLLLFPLLSLVPLTVFAQQPELLVQTGHANTVASVAFSPDGQTLASGSDDNTAKLWDVASGQLLRTFTEHSKKVAAVAFSPDGKTLASGSADRTIKLWDVATGHPLGTFARLGGEVLTIAFSPDGKTLAGGGEVGQVMLWDVATGHLLRTMEGHCCVVYSITFSPDGKSLASVGTDNLVKLWDVATGQLLRALTGHSTSLHAVAFAPDGQTLASGGSFDDPIIKLWEVATGRELRTLKGHSSAVYALTFSRDGETLVSGSWDHQVKLWDVATGQELQTLKGHSEGVSTLAFSPDGKTLASGSADRTIKLWDITTQNELRTLAGYSSTQFSSSFSPDNKIMASGSGSTIKLWDVATGNEVQRIESLSGMITSVTFSPDGRTLVSGSEHGAIELWDVATGQLLRPLAGHSNWIWSTAFSADGKLLASASADRTIKIWNVATGRLLRRLVDYTSAVLSVALSPDGKTLLSGGNDSLVKVWNVLTGRLLRTLKGHSDWVWSVAFSHDGKRLASGSSDTMVKVWDAATGRHLRTLEGHAGAVYSVAFSADDRILFSGNQLAKLWEEATGKELATVIALDRQDWLVVTPEGLFDGSPAAWSRIFWRFSDRLRDIAPVEIFFNEFFYPGLLADLMAGNRPSAPRSIAQLDRHQPQVMLALANEQPAGMGITARNAMIKIEVTDATSEAHDVRLFRNGSLVKVWHGDVLKGHSSVTLEATIPIVAGENRLTAYAFNHDNIKSSSATLTISKADSLKRQGTAYVLAIGVNSYANPAFNLKYATPDAQDFGQEWQHQQALLGLYQRVEVIPLLNQDATKRNILLALKLLSGAASEAFPPDAPAALKHISAAQPEDAVVIYFSGHGIADRSRFYLIPHDLGYMGPRTKEGVSAQLQTIFEHAISDAELGAVLETVDAGQMLLVIDACNSGQVLEAEEKRRGPMNSKGVAQLAYEKGMYILTAAQSYQVALETAKLGHGYLTYALVEEGLKRAQADRQPQDGQILLREWLDYATTRVPQLQQEKMGQGEKQLEQVNPSTPALTKRKADDVQRPRVFYRRELESHPLIVAMHAQP